MGNKWDPMNPIKESKFGLPFGVIGSDIQALSFISKDLEDRGWTPALDLRRRTVDGSFAFSFWVPMDKLDNFKNDVRLACKPFGLEEEHHNNYILLS